MVRFLVILSTSKIIAIAFTRQGSEVQILSRLPLKDKESQGVMLGRQHPDFLFGARFVHLT